MRSYPIALFFVAGLAWTQDSGAARPEAAPPRSPQPPAELVVHRLDGVNWNPASRELSWAVSVWDMSGDKEKQIAKQDYTVRLDSATMKSNGETRSFDSEEARQVRLVMDMISAYAVGSTVWWQRGEGEKTEDCPEDEKGKGEKSKPSPRPASVALPGPIAAAQPLPPAGAVISRGSPASRR